MKKVGSRGDKAELELSGRNTTVVGGGRLAARDYVRSILSLKQAGPSHKRRAHLVISINSINESVKIDSGHRLVE